MKLRPRSSVLGAGSHSGSLPFPLGPPHPECLEEVLVDRLNRQNFPVMMLAAMDDLLAATLMSTKKKTEAHRLTILSRVIDTPQDNALLLDLCSRFNSWLKIESAEERLSGLETIRSFVSSKNLVQEENMTCFEQ